MQGEVLTIDQEIERARSVARTASSASMATTLRGALGDKLFGYVVSSDPSTIADWTAGTEPTQDHEISLRRVFEIYLILEPRDDDATIRAWMVGMNPMLDDRAPAELMADGDFASARVAARSLAILS